MRHFTIDAENNITVHASAQEAQAVSNAECFKSAGQLAKLADGWPLTRLVEIWNSLPAASPVKKFTDRKRGVERIWKAIQSLGEGSAAPEPEVGAMPDISIEQQEVQTVEPGLAPEIDALQGTDAPVAGPDESLAEAGSAEDPVAQYVPAEFSQAEPLPPVGAQAPDVAPPAPEPAAKTIRRKKTAPGEPKAKTAREGNKTTTILELMKRPGGTSLKEIMDATGWQAHSVRGFVSGTLGKKMGLTVVSAKGENGGRNYSIQP